MKQHSNHTVPTPSEHGSQDATALKVKMIFGDLGEDLSHSDPAEIAGTNSQSTAPTDTSLESLKEPLITTVRDSSSAEVCHDEICHIADINERQPGYERKGVYDNARTGEEAAVESNTREEGFTAEIHIDELAIITAQADDQKSGEEKLPGLSESFILAGHSYL